MLDTEPEKPPASNIQVFLGFLLGIVASLGGLFLAIFLGALVKTGGWIYPTINAIALVGVGILAARRVRESSFARGALIALSLALLLNVVYGASLSR
jgi:FtsH-binding integral membrane protein